MVLYLFLSHLGIGIAFTLAFVGREAGVKFFRFNAGLAATLIAVGMAARPTGASAYTDPDFLALVATEAAIVLYWATVGRSLVSVRPVIAGTAIVGGVVTLVVQALVAAAGRSVSSQALTVASFLSSSAMLGGACTAMILGHWYLVLPSMDVSLLQTIVKVHIGSMVVRIAVVGAAIFFAIATWQPGLGLPSFRHYIFSLDGIFFWQRMLFGLGAPSLLSYLTWETAKIRSTQSATGILYVDFFTVVVGEVLAKYVFLAMRVPV